ncbi:MAG: type I polyketide synthase, partial [Gammaproteobacteria bacterium]
MSNELENGIAIIGIAGRFPGAGSTHQFWRNLEQGTESVTFLSEEELKTAHVGDEVLNSANYVKASTLLENVDRFDAAFFGITQREAMVLDPQHRFFLECSWEAFENAGYVPDRYPGLIGVYAGASLNTYMMYNLACHPMFLTTPDGFQALIGNEKDYLATRVAYKLNLRGPAVTVQTACSTSLAAVHMACQSLHLGECDIALAGGVSIKIPQAMGYFHQDGLPFSKDGHCRAFDASSSGTVFGSGVGVVLLRRLEEAVEANDDILAVIKASSMNNDGSSKVGFTAPSSQGQSDVISQALSIADLPPETITYVEAHGTGTPLGDPIEIEALTEAYSGGTDKKGYCAIGSVKTNVGHLETASGVAGLIKVVQMLRHGRLVPSLNYDTPNPQIQFEDTPFFVNRETRDWPKSDEHPRRAAVSSFGMGGTNVHASLEEAPKVREQKIDACPYALLTLSSRSRKGLDGATEALRVWLNEHAEADLGRVAATLQLGRKAFEHRRTLVCKDLADAVRVLDTKVPDRMLTHQALDVRSVAFVFAGGGAQYAGMTAELY